MCNDNLTSASEVGNIYMSNLDGPLGDAMVVGALLLLLIFIRGYTVGFKDTTHSTYLYVL